MSLKDLVNIKVTDADNYFVRLELPSGNYTLDSNLSAEAAEGSLNKWVKVMEELEDMQAPIVYKTPKYCPVCESSHTGNICIPI